MGKFIEFDCEQYAKRTTCRIRADLISYVGPAHADGKTVVGFDGENTVVVHGTPAEVLAKIEAAEGGPVEPAPGRPATIRVDELRVGDEIRLHGEIARVEVVDEFPNSNFILRLCFDPGGPCENHDWTRNSTIGESLLRGVPVYRDGKLISGWPVDPET